MGFLWDLIQQSQIGEQRDKAASLEERISRLERDADQTRALLAKLIQHLEKRLGEDLDGDGRVG